MLFFLCLGCFGQPAPQAPATHEAQAEALSAPVDLGDGCLDFGIAKVQRRDPMPDEPYGGQVLILPADASCGQEDRARASLPGDQYELVGTWQHVAVLRLVSYVASTALVDLHTGKNTVYPEPVMMAGPAPTATLKDNVVTVTSVRFGEAECTDVGDLRGCVEANRSSSDLNDNGVTPTCTGQILEQASQMSFGLTATLQITLPGFEKVVTKLECFIPQ